MSAIAVFPGPNPYGKVRGEGFHTSLRKSRSLRPMLHCLFCGGRVVSIGSGRDVISYRCEAEGIRWDASENLTVYTRDPAASPRLRVYDKETGRFVAEAEA